MRRCLDALTDRPFDLIVLGGGSSGAGVALDATLRGLRVALLERGDFASGTSSISSKLVHGGLRYLEHGDLHLVHEALHERRRLLSNAPHLVWPLRFVIPFHAGDRVPGWKWRAGLTLYDLLAGRGNLRRSRSLPHDRLCRDFPGLRRDGLRGGAEYADAGMDDARLCLAIIRTAAEHGAVVANHVAAIALERTGDQVCGVHAVDRLSGRELRLRGAVIVNATGPWGDAVRRLAGETAGTLLAPTKGVHLVAPGRGLAAAFLLLHPRDGRVFFVLPWLDKTLIGTTDTDCHEPPDALTITDEEVAYLLEGHNHHFTPPLQRGELLGSFAGVRPLARVRPGEPSARSREHRIVEGPSGLISVVGGKWTTYRPIAEEITDVVLRRLNRRRRCRTHTCRLDGAPREPWAEWRSAAIASLHSDGLAAEAARHLVDRYGQRAFEVAAYARRDPALAQPLVAGEPDLRGEFAYQRDHEMACTADDHLLRRTHLGWFCPGIRMTPDG